MNIYVPLTKAELDLLIALIKDEREKERKKPHSIYDEVLVDIQAKLEVMKNAK